MRRSLHPSFLLLLAIAFVDMLGIGLVYPMFSSMIFHPTVPLLGPGISEGMKGVCLGALLSTMPAVQFFAGPILGALSDQKGRKSIITKSLIVGVVGYLVAFIAVLHGSFLLLLFSRMLVGVSAANISVVSASIADVSTPEQKPKNFGLLNMAWGLGFAVGPFVGGRLAEVSFAPPFATPFLLAGLMTLLNLLGVLLLLRETHLTPVTDRISWRQGLRNLKLAFQKRTLCATYITAFVAFFGWSFYYEFIPVTWIQRYGLSTASVGALYGYAALFYAVSSGLLIRPIVGALKPVKVLLLALVLLAASIWGLLINTSPIWLYILLPLQNFALALSYPTFSTVVSNAGNESNQGELLGILQSVDSFAFAISPISSGILLSYGATMPILVGGAAHLLAALIALRYLLLAKRASN